MNTPKTFEEWWITLPHSFSYGTTKEIVDKAWHAAQAAVANPWHEWAKEKPTADQEIILLQWCDAKNKMQFCIASISSAFTDLIWENRTRIAWQYITPSPISVTVKSEAEKAWYENRENLEHAITHAAFCEAFNLGLEKGKV